MVERMKRLQKELRKLKDGISPLERSGHRHAVTRNLYAEHRVEKEKNLKKVKNVHPTFGPLGESANVDDDDDFEGEESSEDSFESGGDDVDEKDEAAEYSSPERRDIHFGGTNRRSEVSTEETDDWVVTDDVPGGPCDGSVIPSFLGHTTYQLWNGEPRDYLTIKPAKKSLSRLHGWVLPAVQVQAWVWTLLALTLFLDRSGGRISASLMNELHGGQAAVDYLDWYRSHSHPFLLSTSVPSTSRIPVKNCITYWMREMERLTRGCIDNLKKLDLGLGEEWDTRLDDVIFRHSQAP
ncbi:OLC1v1036809C1 [Oldenlandia corymbosa var. corymbosa]|uniref:OLC1v1036809C1 n=1 Tax=Oldenlandia corymbosa var. corymbosa TaxID=529605 RepID=A0AAV1CW78_OLDCO|nr:OLC1v1036809C1 [Oldenlandia corymbosa var. corymbosa]